MCGIAGALYRSGQRPDPHVLERMASSLAHRGPDGSGVASFEGAGLAHRRLAVLDLSDAAAQPLSVPDGRASIVFNGEIYNFRGLRNELEESGEQLKSTGDTEVILRLYMKLGLSAIERLDGMFAFAIWDRERRELVLARDRTGKKPLYVYEDSDKILFGSEIKAILAHPHVDRSLWPEAVPQFLSHGYVPTPRTFYRRIRKLQPASFEVFRLHGSDSGPKRYWDFPIATGENEAELSAREAQTKVREAFTKAVESRLVADVPVGAFLSGGVDSSLVVAVMTRLSSRPVKTFSIGFEGHPQWDETEYARIVAKRFNTDHTEFKVRPESFDLIEKLAWHYDEPFGDASAIPTFIVSSLTRQHVTVALTGDGGDEVFAGYPRFIAGAYAERVPARLRRSIGALARRAPEPTRFEGRAARTRRFAIQIAKDLPERLRGWLTLFPVEELRTLLNPELAEYASVETVGRCYEEHLSKAAGADTLNSLLYLNAQTYLLDDLNVKMDRASMAASLETRAPFLDTGLIELVFSLPARFKVRGMTTKWLLKRAFHDLLPREIVHRRKMGFGVPLGAWFRGELKNLLSERLLSSDSSLFTMLRRSELERLVQAHHAGAKDYGTQLWALWMLELFLRKEASAGERAN